MVDASQRLSLIVSKVSQLTPHIHAYELRDAAGKELPLVTAGSHITLEIPISPNNIVHRQYALAGNPACRDLYEIAVAVSEHSSPGSQFIVKNLHPGTRLECSLPANNFQLHADSSPAVLFAEGIGIAAIKSIAHTLNLRGRRFALHYAGASRTDMAFLDELESMFHRHLIVYAADEDMHINLMNTLADAPGNAFIYACGSTPFLDELETTARLLGTHKDRIQLEYFFAIEDKKDKPLVIELAYSNKLIHVEPQQSLLNALRAAGISVDFDCCVGDCGTCAVQVLAGTPEHRDHVLSDAQKAEGFMCLCVSRATGEKLVLAL